LKQIVQNLNDGTTELLEVPAPAPRSGHLLIGTLITLVSSGTERMLVDFGRANILGKARMHPDRVRMVVEKARADGVVATYEAVRSKLDEPMALGYCNVGRVIEADAATGFLAGERVVSNGPHAEIVRVPRNLCAKVPDPVSDETAAFTVLGAIALQGVRLAGPTLGETVFVSGLGLIGLLAVQVLRANGCRVIAADFDRARLEAAREFGAHVIDLGAGHDPVAVALSATRDRGVDAVLVTASTDSNEPISQAARMSRKRGRIVLVGVAGLELSRAEFYAKELSLQVSCSYGPGRYDSTYEEGGNDYPIGFVRWTEQRNFEAVLDLMADGKIRTERLVTHRFASASASAAYSALRDDRSALGILLKFSRDDASLPQRTVPFGAPAAGTLLETGRVSFVGAGNYATRILMPAFRKAGAKFGYVVTTGAPRGVIQGRRYGFAGASTDATAALEDATTAAVVIATRHDSHAELVRRALKAGKHVFVEKPLALTLEDLRSTLYAYRDVASRVPVVLTVGFNRRFAPLVIKMHELLQQVPGPKAFSYTVNAGAVPPDHWTQDAAIGGGRIAGEACHFIDLLRFLAGSTITSAQATGQPSGRGTIDTAVITLRFSDGSLGTIQYLSNGGRAFPKERLEAFADGRTLQLDNFRRLRSFNWPAFGGRSLWRQDKGQDALVRRFLAAVHGEAALPIPVDEIEESSRVTIECAEALRAPA
jgi:predicted dehydrogenase/threonine dehydrogenase-like Zn-dependent dehydrogenase